MSAQESPQDWRELEVLERIESDAQISQRTLARDLGVALGLTNSILRRLGRKGLIKTKQLCANRLAYYLTPKGVREKGRLVLEYVRLTTSFFYTMRQLLRQRLQELKAEGAAKTVAVVGTGELAEAAFLSIQEAELRLVGVYDADRAGERWLGMMVQSPDSFAGADLTLLARLEPEERAPPPLAQAEDTRVIDLRELLSSNMRAFARRF